ncbi:MAG: cytochrome c biogenesis protein CcmE [Ponticaulis sp.]|nr:cytochrome c biogenesis protein CcmE [Ponticaulis sp.]|tara:strand:+ start:9893 stop:10336 length:444 start_codon:yes stop_codon:yes gene_type:complete
MRARARRFWLIVVAGVLLAGATGLTLSALSSDIDAFYVPGDLVERGGGMPGERAQIGGLVKEGSIETTSDGQLHFVVEDAAGEIKVSFEGFIPDLFREGQGVICKGTFTEAWAFQASELLAKHDENYMPRELEDALKEQGVYKGEGA